MRNADSDLAPHPIAWTTLVACYASPGTPTLDFSSLITSLLVANNSSAAPDAWDEKLISLEKHTDTLVLGVSGWVVLSLLRRAPLYPDNPPSPILRNHTQRQCAGSRRSNDMFINILILSILSDRCTSSRATSQFSQSQSYLISPTLGSLPRL